MCARYYRPQRIVVVVQSAPDHASAQHRLASSCSAKTLRSANGLGPGPRAAWANEKERQLRRHAPCFLSIVSARHGAGEHAPQLEFTSAPTNARRSRSDREDSKFPVCYGCTWLVLKGLFCAILPSVDRDAANWRKIVL